MNKQKIQKIAKRLQKFRLDDISVLVDEKTEIILQILSIMETELIIKKNGNEYFYIKQKNDSRNDLANCVLPLMLTDNKQDLEIYNSSTDCCKRKIDLIINLLKITKDLKGKDLMLFLNNQKEDKNDKSVCYVTLMKYRRDYLKYGIKGLISKNSKMEKKKRFDLTIYNEFKKLYLHPIKLSAVKCVTLIKNDGRFINLQVPDEAVLRRKIHKEFSDNTIKKFRSRDYLLPELESKLSLNNVRNKPIFDNYNDAVSNYFYSKLFLNKSIKTQKLFKVITVKHLNPFFKDLTFEQIDQIKISEFYTLKSSEGMSIASILICLSILRMLTRLYFIQKPKFNLYNFHEANKKHNNYKLTNDKIKLIINSNRTIANILAFTLALGLTQAEVIGLTYDNINIKNMNIEINGRYHNGCIEKYRCAYRKRVLALPQSLINKFSHKKTGRIFDISVEQLTIMISDIGKELDIKNLLYQDFIDAHIKISINNNISIMIIAKNLGYKNIDYFVNDYEELIFINSNKSFDILNFMDYN